MTGLDISAPLDAAGARFGTADSISGPVAGGAINEAETRAELLFWRRGTRIAI
jgi:hypothetical protein